MITKEISSVVDLLERMVEIDTVNEVTSGKPFPERALLELIEKIAADSGFSVQRLGIPVALHPESYNLLISYEVSPTAPWLLFESHADTVGVDGMSMPPFTPKIDEGRIYGRGVCDTKASGAALLSALQRYVADSGNSVQPNNIALLFVTDEEIGKTGAKAFVGEQLGRLPWKPKAIFVGEPTMCGQVVAHNGVIRWKVQTKGVAAHSSKPENGKSAISAMAKLLLGFEREYCAKLNQSHPLTGDAVCSINTISGGVAVNIIPDLCEVELDRRTLPGEDSQVVLQEIADTFRAIAATDPSIDFEMLDPFVDPPLDPRVNASISRQLAGILERCGLSGEPQGAGYGTDASTYSEAGIPAIVIGPGSIAQAHTEDEWLELEQLTKSVELYHAIMRCDFE